MSPFTVRDTPVLRARIQRDLDIVVRTVRAGDPHLRALVLTGGFARGEGTVLAGEPQNDYDFVAIRTLGRCTPYAGMAAQLTDEVGLPIDLKPIWAPRLHAVARSIFWYETALRGQVLWGEEQLLERIPVRHPAEIHATEGMRLLANRAAGLLLYSQADAATKRIQACKALLGALDAHLLAQGLFPPTHVERWEMFQHLRRRGTSPSSLRAHPEDLLWAFQFKTWPDDAPPMDADQVWEQAADALLAAVPTALRHAGLRGLDAYGRKDTWVERMYYWLRAGQMGTRPWLFHPSSKVRVATLRFLEERRQGAPGDAHVQRLVRSGQRDIDALQLLRQATLQ